MHKILVIEDEENLRELVSYNLKNNGYRTIEAEDGLQGLEMAFHEKPDLILLDIMMPGMNGLDVCKELRARKFEVPIIILSARNEDIDKVMGLELGADDYMTKPFSIHELMARIKAVFRRWEQTSNQRQIKIRDLIVDMENRAVTVGGRTVELSLKEFDLLNALAEKQGKVMTRDQILDRVWGMDYDGETRTVDVHIRYLRRKLGTDQNGEKYIQTIRGLGYKIL